jgi:hypothetical protein
MNFWPSPLARKAILLLARNSPHTLLTVWEPGARLRREAHGHDFPSRDPSLNRVPIARRPRTVPNVRGAEMSAKLSSLSQFDRIGRLAIPSDSEVVAD